MPTILFCILFFFEEIVYQILLIEQILELIADTALLEIIGIGQGNLIYISTLWIGSHSNSVMGFFSDC